MAIIWKGDEVAAEIERRSMHNARVCGETLLALVAEKAPKDTGELAASGILVVDPNEPMATVTFGLGLRTNYGYFQEFGPANGIAGGPPNPYFRPALYEFHAMAYHLMGGN